MADRTARRSLWTVVLALLAAAVLLWLASRLTWTTAVDVRPGTGARVPVRHSGADQVPALVPLAVLAVAGVAGAVAVGGWPRRIVGALLVLAGLGALALAVLAGGSSTGEAFFPWGRSTAGLGGVLVAAAGCLLVRDSARLPRLGAAYQAPDAARRATDPDAELWRVLSEGEDPTAGPGQVDRGA